MFCALPPFRREETTRFKLLLRLLHVAAVNDAALARIPRLISFGGLIRTARWPDLGPGHPGGKEECAHRHFWSAAIESIKAPSPRYKKSNHMMVVFACPVLRRTRALRTRASMSKTTVGTDYSARLALFDKLVATNPKVERKGATVPYTSLNGHMFSYLGKTGELALRLPADEREAFLEKYKTKLCELYGVVQKEYVMVPDSLLKNTKELKPYFDASFAYVSAMKPKPTKKAKG